MNLRKFTIHFLAVLGLAFIGCQSNQSPDFEAAEVREYANALYNRELYHQAIDQYETYLEEYNPDKTEAANINYIVGDIYFERLHDYENALTHYLKIKHLYPESSLVEEVDTKMIACLERLQRSADAQQLLDESSALDPSQARKSRPGTVVAKIGKREVTTGDLEHEIGKLPPYIQSQLSNKSDKADFLRQYIASELLYDTAKRKGLDNDKEVIEAAFLAKKNLMVQKLLEEEISLNVNISQSDVELYYKANREEYAEKDESGNIVRLKPLEEVRTQVRQDLIREKQQEAYDRLVQRMMRAEAVEIYEDKLN